MAEEEKSIEGEGFLPVTVDPAKASAEPKGAGAEEAEEEGK